MSVDHDSASVLPCRSRIAWSVWLGALLLIALGTVAYSNTFSVPFLFDDLASIPENPTIRELWPLAPIFLPWTQRATVVGRPIINFSLALNYAVGELEVGGYHVFNLAVHLLAGLTLFGLIRRTLLLPRNAERFGSRATGLALSCALLWTLHPLQTESVTYLIQRAESLGGLFYLLILYCLLRSATANGVKREIGWSVAAVICCLLGVGCKEVLATAPVVALLYDRFFLSNSIIDALQRRRFLYCGFAAAWIVQGVLVVSAGNRGGSAGFGSGVTPGQYLASQFGAVLHYLRLSIWPRPLVFDYGKYLPLPTSAIIIPAMILSGIGLILVLIARRQPWVGFVALTGALILAPSSSIIPVATQVMTEHRMYLPLASVIILAVFGAEALYQRVTRSQQTMLVDRMVRGGVVGALVLLSIYGTFSRNRDYRSALSIWEDTAAKVPQNARAVNNYGAELFRSGKPAEALREYEAAIALRQKECDPFYNRALLAEQRGDLQQAVRDMAEAVRYCPDSDVYVEKRAVLLLKLGDYEQAASAFTRALQLIPDSTLYHFERGNCYMFLGKYRDALRDFTQVVVTEPDAFRAWHNRGNVHARLGQLEESIRDLTRAIEIRPDLAPQYANRAASYYENRQYEQAWSDVEQCRKRGGTVDPEFLRLLKERLATDQTRPEQ